MNNNAIPLFAAQLKLLRERSNIITHFLFWVFPPPEGHEHYMKVWSNDNGHGLCQAEVGEVVTYDSSRAGDNRCEL